MITLEKLDNGIRVVMERMEGCRSVAIGAWVKAGSVDENSGENGITHFIEHMLFKGTSSRSAKDIAVEMDAVGGNLNAFTAKECTCFYANILDEHVDLAVDVLADMIMNPRLDPDDIGREKGVVIDTYDGRYTRGSRARDACRAVVCGRSVGKTDTRQGGNG